MPRGIVQEFDAHTGLGVIKGDDGTRLTFHCTQITDESRAVPIGAAVHFDLAPGQLGAWEASVIEMIAP